MTLRARRTRDRYQLYRGVPRGMEMKEGQRSKRRIRASSQRIMHKGGSVFGQKSVMAGRRLGTAGESKTLLLRIGGK